MFNVLTCSRQSTPAVGQALTGSNLVAKLSFTGSTAVGKVRIEEREREEGEEGWDDNFDSRTPTRSCYLSVLKLSSVFLWN